MAKMAEFFPGGIERVKKMTPFRRRAAFLLHPRARPLDFAA
jgi:hypothetical protein